MVEGSKGGREISMEFLSMAWWQRQRALETTQTADLGLGTGQGPGQGQAKAAVPDLSGENPNEDQIRNTKNVQKRDY
jgi:hypothetical protein